MRQNPPITVYTPESSLANPSSMIRAMVRDLAAGRELAWRLAVRDIKSQYRQAFLGLLWAFILPAANTAVWIFLSKAGMLTPAGTELPYPLYVFTGAMLWAIFMEAVNAPMQQVNGSRGMLAKVNFPREALIVSGVYQTLFNAGIKVALMLAVLWIAGVGPGWHLLLFPLSLLGLVLLGTALGLLITPVGMLYSDAGRALPLLMQFVMYLTPAVLPMPKDGWASALFMLNPVTPLLLTARSWVTGQSAAMPGYFLVVVLAASCALIVLWAIYRLAIPIVVERIGG